MGACYSGDINGKFWRGFLDREDLECYGNGEAVYYCESRGTSVIESEMTDEERDACDDEPASLFFSFEDREVIAEILLERIKIAEELCATNSSEYQALTSGYKTFSGDFFAHLKEIVNDKKIVEAHIDGVIEPLLNLIYDKYPHSDVFGEVCIGIKILECIDRTGMCEFYAELEC